MTIRASIMGGSGYTGGELLRLLLGHPEVTVAQVTSTRLAGQFVYSQHPNLRGATALKFVSPEALEPVDLLFVALPHGLAANQLARLESLAPRLIDLSADFRLDDPAVYQRWYERPHPVPEALSQFAYGLPELNRAAIQGAHYVSGVGCNATAVNLALAPLAHAGLIRQAVADLKVGSSEGGADASAASHHPERSGSLRSFAPTGHRHQAEVAQLLGDFELHLSVTSVELVRGVLCTAHVFLNESLSEKAIWRLYREQYGDEPFVRLVSSRRGLHRYPEPKLLAGSNFCDIGFALDEATGRLVVLSAIDNLMKGASGSAVQCMNLMYGWPETTGLTFLGLHPI
jgi:N-acetyl-gamma-glutamyl-phosphate/LysW-gamma-L-alpha-aminoadipyl-6-phosphate reductase